MASNRPGHARYAGKAARSHDDERALPPPFRSCRGHARPRVHLRNAAPQSAPAAAAAITAAAVPPWYPRLQRLRDVCVAGPCLIALLPLFALVALLIWLEDRGPVLFKQARVGKDGAPFPFFKFRSMVVHAEQMKKELAARNEAEGPIFKMREDPRVTRVGRFLRKYSIDELPQLVNVLRGEMSLVGPRPHLPSEVCQYTERQRQRLSIPPGLVCLREVYGRSNLSFERWIELDLLYIEYRSFGTDLRLLLRVIPAVFRGEGAY